MAVGQKQWYHLGVGAPPILVHFSEDWDAHWGYDLGFDPWRVNGFGPCCLRFGFNADNVLSCAKKALKGEKGVLSNGSQGKH